MQKYYKNFCPYLVRAMKTEQVSTVIPYAFLLSIQNILPKQQQDKNCYITIDREGQTESFINQEQHRFSSKEILQTNVIAYNIIQLLMYNMPKLVVYLFATGRPVECTAKATDYIFANISAEKLDKLEKGFNVSKPLLEVAGLNTNNIEMIIDCSKMAKNKDLPDQILNSDIKGLLNKLTQKEIDNLQKSIKRGKIQSINF